MADELKVSDDAERRLQALEEKLNEQERQREREKQLKSAVHSPPLPPRGTMARENYERQLATGRSLKTEQSQRAAIRAELEAEAGLPAAEIELQTKRQELTAEESRHSQALERIGNECRSLQERVSELRRQVEENVERAAVDATTTWTTTLIGPDRTFELACHHLRAQGFVIVPHTRMRHVGLNPGQQLITIEGAHDAAEMAAVLAGAKVKHVPDGAWRLVGVERTPRRFLARLVDKIVAAA
jgi:hypothetical protein